MRRTGAFAAILALAGCEARYVYQTPAGTPFAELAPAAPLLPLDALRARADAAGQINSPFERDEAFKKLVADAAARGDAADPAALAEFTAGGLRKMNTPFTRDEAAAGCARSLARRGLTAEATVVARTINSPFARDEALKVVAAGGP